MSEIREYPLASDFSAEDLGKVYRGLSKDPETRKLILARLDIRAAKSTSEEELWEIQQSLPHDSDEDKQILVKLAKIVKTATGLIKVLKRSYRNHESEEIAYSRLAELGYDKSLADKLTQIL